MKYEPRAPVGRRLVDILMAEPFYQPDRETDWELVDVVTEAYDTLSEADKQVLHEVYFLRSTYEDTAKNIGIKAKSHAWRKAHKALNNLKVALLQNERFMEKYGSKYVE